MGIKRDSMIKNDGSLLVSIPASKATWFDVLTQTRATNSPNGGWNFKKYWEDTLKQLTDNPEILEKWTKNSLDLSNEDSPKPRCEQFMFKREESDAHKSAAKRVGSLSISKADENALIRCLYERKALKRNDKHPINLLGYEIPLSSESEGQLKVDLYGWSQDDGGRLEIVEMKKACNTRDSPLFAFVEAVCYAIQSIRCWDDLKKELPNISDSPLSIGLTVAAPEKYWKYWGKGDLALLMKPINKILKSRSDIKFELSYSSETLIDSDFCANE